MSSTGKLGAEVELKSIPDKIWTAIQDSTTVFPKALPNHYKSIEVLEGDGKSVGSIRIIKYPEGLITMTKEKIEVVDEANKTMAYSVLDGDLSSAFKSFKGQVIVAPKGEGSLVKWSAEFEKEKEDIPDPHLFKDFAIGTFQELDAYLLKA